MTVCRRYSRDQKEAEDILQESFIRVFANIGQYRFEGPLEAWIRRIVVHTALKIIRKQRIHFADLDLVRTSEASARSLAENYVGLPFD